MKKTALFVASVILLGLSSCVTHKTCPTYMKNNTSSETVWASAKVK